MLCNTPTLRKQASKPAKGLSPREPILVAEDLMIESPHQDLLAIVVDSLNKEQ